MSAKVCVVITARNASATCGDAVLSALQQPEVAEVVLIDDASTDDTAAAAQHAAGGDARLRVLRQSENIGPAAGRNLAIANSTAPYLAILDADDYFLPGRFARLMGQTDWDLIADNIVFVPAEDAALIAPADLPTVTPNSQKLDLTDFVLGNLSLGATQRGELGFLKPVMSRRFLQEGGLSYDSGLWLGEDYDLYVRMLLKGGRFHLTNAFGYAARVRSDSLSGRHRTKDLVALMAASARHAADTNAPRPAVHAMRRHYGQIHKRYLLREFLDRKAQGGLGAAMTFALRPPSNLPPITMGILKDKLRARSGPDATPVVSRFLLPIKS